MLVLLLAAQLSITPLAMAVYHRGCRGHKKSHHPEQASTPRNSDGYTILRAICSIPEYNAGRRWRARRCQSRCIGVKGYVGELPNSYDVG